MRLDMRSLLETRGSALAAVMVVLLSGCGGGGSGTASDATGAPASSAASANPAPVATAQTQFATEGAVPAEVAGRVLTPAYHLAPVLPPAPNQIDADGSSSSAHVAPTISFVPEALRSVPTRGLTVDRLQPSAPINADAGPAPTGSVSSYTPAQIRAAYGLPALPSSLTGITALQAAQLGAGATIYLVDAYHDPNAYAELAFFSQQFGLPACNNKSLATSTKLPLGAPTANQCDFYQVYASGSGTLTATAPAYNSGWSTEIALDVQWAHAIAPLARIILVEAIDASNTGLTGAIELANVMGPGVVSMSWGGAETSYDSYGDAYFKTSGMSYFAATGDNGYGVSWPAVSPYVVAVGGTSLVYTGTGARSETAWTGTGGGISAYEPVPAYQSSGVPGITSLTGRSVADVSLNADPYHGQYIALISSSTSCASCQAGWATVGGTSLATPMWAAVAAIANSLRVQAGKSVLGDPHSLIYGSVADVSATYSADLLDITSGSDGSCSGCSAKKGYDVPTGLGTPNGLALINSLVNASVTPTPPVVTGATINGTYNQPLSFTASVSDANAYTLSLTGAPSGLTISSAAVVSWANPVAGTYPVTVTAKDSVTGMTGQGVYKIVIAPPPAPVVSSASVTGTTGQALSFPLSVTAADAYTLALSGAPSGMALTATGTVSWAKPVAGTYKVTVTATDKVTLLSGQGVYTVAISAPLPPTVASAKVTGVQGTALSFGVSVTDANAVTLTLAGAPSGMTVSSSGTVSWPKPVTGSYAVTVTAKDTTTGLSGSAVYTVVISASAGPTISDANLSGSSSQALNGTISITDSSAMVVSLGIGGAPLGMSFAPIGSGISNFSVKWAKPVVGSYSLTVQVTDSAGRSAQATLPVTITK